MIGWTRCRATEEQLVGTLLGTLAAPEWAEMEHHLSGCAPCRRTLRTLELAEAAYDRAFATLRSRRTNIAAGRARLAAAMEPRVGLALAVPARLLRLRLAEAAVAFGVMTFAVVGSLGVEPSPAAPPSRAPDVLVAPATATLATAAPQPGDPERTRALLERFYEAMAAEISAAGGTVEKFAGDAVMAAFGAPDAYEDHAERALHAALSMRRQLETLFAGQLIVRIGVNTGDVMVGRPREGSSFVTGDAVNVAARLEQAAAPGEILVGERTVAASRGAFEFTEPMTVEAKGKPGGVPCRRLIRSLSLSRPRGIPGLGRAFVGREREFDRLLDAYHRTATEGRPRLVTLAGDAGVGKTRLVRELWEKLADERPQPLRRTGRCLPYGRGITYWPLGEMLREHLGILESDSPADVRDRLGDREILGLTLGLDTAGDLHPLAARDRLHDAWIAFLDSLVAELPLVALIEDLHWAEPPLLDLIEQLARDVDGPLLLVGTARPDFISTLARKLSRGNSNCESRQRATGCPSASTITAPTSHHGSRRTAHKSDRSAHRPLAVNTARKQRRSEVEVK